MSYTESVYLFDCTLDSELLWILTMPARTNNTCYQYLGHIWWRTIYWSHTLDSSIAILTTACRSWAIHLLVTLSCIAFIALCSTNIGLLVWTTSTFEWTLVKRSGLDVYTHKLKLVKPIRLQDICFKGRMYHLTANLRKSNWKNCILMCQRHDPLGRTISCLANIVILLDKLHLTLNGPTALSTDHIFCANNVVFLDTLHLLLCH